MRASVAPWHAMIGDRPNSSAEVADLLGYDYFHPVVDDHSRLAYWERLADVKAAIVNTFVQRALPPCTPRRNKVERIHETMEREWAKVCDTATAPPATRRCHTGYATDDERGPLSSLGKRPRISRPHPPRAENI